VSTFFSDKNIANREIFNSLNSINNELTNLIKMNDNKIKIKYEKVKNDAKMIKNEYKFTKYKDEDNNNKNQVKHKIITILD